MGIARAPRFAEHSLSALTGRASDPRDALVLQGPDHHATILRLAFSRLVVANLVALAHRAGGQHFSDSRTTISDDPGPYRTMLLPFRALMIPSAFADYAEWAVLKSTTMMSDSKNNGAARADLFCVIHSLLLQCS